jgi:hypothetical protein
LFTLGGIHRDTVAQYDNDNGSGFIVVGCLADAGESEPRRSA